MIRPFNPPDVVLPASRYSQCVEVTGDSRWLYISGQVGVAPDGTLREGLSAQLDQCFANIDAALRDAGMGKENLVKLTIYVTKGGPEAITTYRTRRDHWLGAEGHTPAGTYVVVSGLASAGFLVEVEAVAAG
jgi:2-iminobutanoate/2-iminopropanoate deaminase